MKKNTIIEAWRNEEYFLSLSEDEKAALPAHPAGPTGIEDEILRSVSGSCQVSTGHCTLCCDNYCY